MKDHNPVNKKLNSRLLAATEIPQILTNLVESILTLKKLLVSQLSFRTTSNWAFNVSLEEVAVDERKCIFMSAAYYALTEEEVDEVMNHSNEDHLNVYLSKLVIISIRLFKYEAADSVHIVFQTKVFAPTVECHLLQLHLNLKPGQCMHSL